MNAQITSGVERFARQIDLDGIYGPYAFQNRFHGSVAKHRLLGGAAGPGKTAALIFDHLIACNEFSLQDGPQVKTLLLRRTDKKLNATLVARFEEKVPRELYSKFTRSPGKTVVTWLNGAQTWFGAMQYEHDVMGWQGQWLKIGYDELTEFTFKQWSGISAWNRCPVSPYATKDGASNPVGIGADWAEHLFILKRPWSEMDANQRAQYRPDDYEYFPGTYLDNPIYANDPAFLENLSSYPEAFRDALMYGKWGVSGGYFQGAWDEAYNVYPAESVEILPHWRKWLSGDWGFEHNSAIYKHCLDDFGIVRTYGELVVNKQDAEQLGESIARLCVDIDGHREKMEFFSFSHDAFAERQDHNPIAARIGMVLHKYGLPEPESSTRDKLGREQLMYEMLRKRVKVGVRRGADGGQGPLEVAAWQIADTCPQLIRTIPRAPRDEKKREQIAEFTGDDPLQGAGYGLYRMFGKPAQKPLPMRVNQRVAELQQQRAAVGLPPQTDPFALAMMTRKAEEDQRKLGQPVRLITRNWRRGNRQANRRGPL